MDTLRLISKNMKIDGNQFVSSSSHQRNQIFLKFIAFFLLIGFAYRLLITDSTVPPVVAPDVPENSLPTDPSGLTSVAQIAQAPSSVDSQNVSTKCDIFTGNWVPDPSGPVYTNVTCRHIQEHQNCLKNGRPDSNYLQWRWKPRDCDLPKFNPEQFLEKMRNKWWAFIGDSIARNHVQSLICILSQVEEVEEIYHDKEYRSKIWRFPSHNFTLSVIWSPFLLKAETFENVDGVSFSDIQLHLDELDSKWTDQYPNFDYVVISGGKWFLKTSIFHENKTLTGCHYCPGNKNNLTELGYAYSYRKALSLVLGFVAKPEHKARVLFRTTTPDHFENGEWNSGGFCNRTMPVNETEGVVMKNEDETMRDIELDEFHKISDSKIGLLDTTSMSFLRPDGHPGPYRYPNPFAGNSNRVQIQNDCLHWCLPGPIDSWNDLMVEVMLNREGFR